MATRLAGFKSGNDLVGQKADISVVPLVGIMLVLLIVFIVSGPIATASLKLDDPPQDWFGSYPKNPQPFVSVREDGVVYVVDQPTTLENLNADLGRRLAVAGVHDKAINVRADRRVPYGAFMAVVNQLSADGYRIGIFNKDLSEPNS